MKKIISSVLSIMMMLNITLFASAANSEYRMYESSVNGNKVITIEYKESGKNIKSVIGAGHRTTSVYDDITKSYELYTSDYKFEYDLDSNKAKIAIDFADKISYKNDKKLGTFSDNTVSENSGINSRAVVTNYVSEYLDAYYYRFTGNQHVLRFKEDPVYITTADSNIVYKCDYFNNSLQSYDSNFQNVLLDVIGYIPAAGTAAGVARLFHDYVLTGAGALETLLAAFIVAVTALPGVGAIANTAVLRSHAGLAFSSHHNAKTSYEYVKARA